MSTFEYWLELAWQGSKCKGKTLLVIENFFTLYRYCTVTVQYQCSVSKAKHDQIFSAALQNGRIIQISLQLPDRDLEGYKYGPLDFKNMELLFFKKLEITKVSNFLLRNLLPAPPCSTTVTWLFFYTPMTNWPSKCQKNQQLFFSSYNARPCVIML